MAAGLHGRERIGRSLSAARDVASLPGWIQLFVIVAVTWLIAAAQFSHVIAGSVEGAFAVFHGAIGWDRFLLSFLVPAFIGNSIGGVVFVALLNHAQVKEEI